MPDKPPSPSVAHPDGFAPTNDVLFGPLTEAVSSGKCIAVIGAGMSAADFPAWWPLLDRLQKRCGIRAEDVQGKDPLDIAEAAFLKSRTDYFAELDEVFKTPDYPKSSTRYHLLARANFLCYINLNFDALMVDTLGLHQDVTVSDYPILQAHNIGNKEVFHIHGRFGPDRPASTTNHVLTRSDFSKAYASGRSRLPGFLLEAFLDNHICFLGCNPAEQHMQELLKVCDGIRSDEHGQSGPYLSRWFFLQPFDTPIDETVEASGVKTVKYPKINSQYLGLDAVLEHLAGKKPPTARRPGPKDTAYGDEGVSP